MIVVVNYGMGNVGSVANIVRKVGGDVRISQGPEDLRGADKVILPGVGSFDNGMKNLRARGYEEALVERVVRGGMPLLGICLGMQMLTRRSEEGSSPGWVGSTPTRDASPSSPDGRSRRVSRTWAGTRFASCSRIRCLGSLTGRDDSTSSTPTTSVATAPRTFWPRRATDTILLRQSLRITLWAFSSIPRRAIVTEWI
jgi:hypothetical protein